MALVAENGPTHIAEVAQAEVERLQVELKRRFAGGGCIARVPDIARLFPPAQAGSVEEALYRLCEEGVGEMDCLRDGALIVHFPRR
jgi:hypothetical protein